MKKNASTIILIFIFFIGLSVLLYPSVADYVNSKSQSRAITQYIESMTQLDPDKYALELAEAQAYNESLIGRTSRFSPNEAELEAYHHYLGSDGSAAIGYLEIPSIRVSLPMYLGTEERVLQVGIGCMPGGSLPIGGESTHTILTGHRGLPSSRLLTDLDQVAVGDTFTMVVLNQVMSYQVDQILIVLPQELDALEIEEGEDLCTLVTCTPYGINTHRMLVRGHRIEGSAADAVAARVTADAIQVDTLLVACAVAAPMLLVFVTVVLAQGQRKRKK